MNKKLSKMRNKYWGKNIEKFAENIKEIYTLADIIYPYSDYGELDLLVGENFYLSAPQQMNYYLILCAVDGEKYLELFEEDGNSLKEAFTNMMATLLVKKAEIEDKELRRANKISLKKDVEFYNKAKEADKQSEQLLLPFSEEEK